MWDGKRQKEKTSVKCSGYYGVDTEQEETKSEKVDATRIKWKKFFCRQRIDIYQKTEGYGYVCWEFVDFDLFEIEHLVLISKIIGEKIFLSCISLQ